MTPLNWYIDILKNKYVKFDGRAGRPEFWFFVLFNFIISLVLGFIDGMFGLTLPGCGVGILGGLYSLAVLIPGIGVGIRRLHDSNRSGWFMLLSLIPIVNIVLLVFMILPGTPGDNRFGPPGPTAPNA